MWNSSLFVLTSGWKVVILDELGTLQCFMWRRDQAADTPLCQPRPSAWRKVVWGKWRAHRFLQHGSLSQWDFLYSILFHVFLGLVTTSLYTFIFVCNTFYLSEPVNGNWAAWSSWGSCSKTCNGGQMRRYRTCDTPRPAFGGRACAGADSQTQRCSIVSCPGRSAFNPVNNSLDYSHSGLMFGWETQIEVLNTSSSWMFACLLCVRVVQNSNVVFHCSGW